MSYKVTKTVKGHKYLYEQTSYRENGKVKTHSTYLGAVSSGAGGSTTQAAEKTLAEASEPPMWKGKPKLSLQNFTCNLKSKHLQMSEGAFNRDYTKTLKKLEALGVDPAKFPAVYLKHGGGYRSYKPPFMNALVVTAPRYKANREQFRTQYRQALHQAFISTLEREAPEKVHQFRYSFDQSYARTQTALARYITSSESKRKSFALMGLRWFSVMNPVITQEEKKKGKRVTRQKKTLDPEKLGLVQYGKVKNWKQDYSVLMAEVDKKGIKSIRARARKEINLAEASQRKKVKEKTIFFIRKRKALRRAEARIQGNKELLYKLNLVEKFL